MSRLFPLALAFAILAAPAAAAQEPVTVFTGETIYSEFISLPPDAEITVALREAASGGIGAVVARAARRTDGAQAPLPFRLEVPSRRLVPESPYALEIAIRLAGSVRWQSEPVPVEPAGGTVDVGQILLHSSEPGASSTVLRCGHMTVRFGTVDDRAVLEVEGQTFTMVETRSASGARYEAEGDPSTVFWSRGDEAILTLQGEELPTCRTIGNAVSGRDVLTGGEWIVETIGGAPVLDEAPDATLAFTADGRLAGRASCNRYTTGYAVNGPRLSVDPRIAVTQMACPPPILDQERRFLDALAAAKRWTVEGRTLTIAGGAAISARRVRE